MWWPTKAPRRKPSMRSSWTGRKSSRTTARSSSPGMTAIEAGVLDAAARVTPEPLARRVRGLSDRAIAWLFIAPTMALLLAINIFPLLWTLRLSFTNYRANRPNAVVKGIGIENYANILTDPDVWAGMQVTARFVIATIVIET